MAKKHVIVKISVDAAFEHDDEIDGELDKFLDANAQQLVFLMMKDAERVKADFYTVHSLADGCVRLQTSEVVITKTPADSVITDG